MSKDTVYRQNAIETALTFFVEYLGGAFHEDDQLMLKKRMEELPPVQPNLQPTCNQLATDCISRQAAIDEIRKCRFVVDAIEKIKDLPAAEPRKGKWLFVHPLQNDDPGSYICSICQYGNWDIKPTDKECPHCGADMREGDAE